MKKYFLLAALTLMGSMVFTACGDDDDDNTPREPKEETPTLVGYWESDKYNHVSDVTFEAYTKKYVCIEKSGDITVVTCNTEVHPTEDEVFESSGYEWENGTFTVEEEKHEIDIFIDHLNGEEQEGYTSQYIYEFGDNDDVVWVTENFTGAEKIRYTSISKQNFQKVLNAAKAPL